MHYIYKSGIVSGLHGFFLKKADFIPFLIENKVRYMTPKFILDSERSRNVQEPYNTRRLWKEFADFKKY